MRIKKFECGITFYTTREMFDKLKNESYLKKLSAGELLRDIINEYYKNNNMDTAKDN